MAGNPSFSKRQKERKRQEKQQEKERERQNRRSEKATTPKAQADGVDPDIAHIVPGQRPSLDEFLPADAAAPQGEWNN